MYVEGWWMLKICRKDNEVRILITRKAFNYRIVENWREIVREERRRIGRTVMSKYSSAIEKSDAEKDDGGKDSEID